MNKYEHPSKDITGTLSNDLKGKKIILCITGSVAAVQSSGTARLLMRHGAEVFPVMTEAACRLIHPDLMEWATGNRPVLTLTGKIEHVSLAGNVKGKCDLILISPSTANTIGKIAAGIDDTPVTTVVTTGLGEGLPLIIVPAMHEPMYNHPFVKENIIKLKDSGISILQPRITEGKAKIADDSEILNEVQKLLAGKKKLSGKKVLITAGRTVEYLDPVRVLTNNSSGKMGTALAAAALAEGADVTLIYGKGTAAVPSGVKLINTETSADMKEAVYSEIKKANYDILIAAAAVGDWKPVEKSDSKISTHTGKNLIVELEPTPKIIDDIKKVSPDIFLTAFRAQYSLSTAKLIDDAHKRLLKADADLIAVNDVGRKGAGFETDTNEIYLVTPDKKTEHIELTSKKNAAESIIQIIASKL